MSMQLLELGGVKVRAVGGEGLPAVLLCHGFGAPGDDLVPLAEALDAKGQWRWFFPEAPLDLRSLGIPGRAWWQIDMMRLQMAMMTGQTRQLAEETPPGLDVARGALEGVIAALERDHAVRRDRLVIGGFSQGAMLSTELALHQAVPFAGLAILSGALISAARWRTAARAAGPALHVFQSHGQRDPILPFTGAVELRELLTASGAELSFVSHGGGHEIPFEALSGLRHFLQARLA